VSLKDSQQFHINELVIVSKAGKTDISAMYKEMSLYDSMFMPVMSGDIVISDALGLSSKLMFDGSESILIDISKTEDSDVASFKKAFRIYKQSNRRSNTERSETYVLNFVSDELLFSDQQRVNQAYKMSYMKMVERIMLDYLKIPENNLNGLYEDSAGERDVIIPNLRPIEAIQWIARKAVNMDNSPSYVFYQNLIGYNFITLSKLLSQSEILDIEFQSKNRNKKSKAISDLSGARSFEVVSQVDTIKRTRAGVNAGTFIGVDPITRMISKRPLSYLDHYENMKHGNMTPNFASQFNKEGLLNTEMHDSRIVLDTFSTPRQLSEYVKSHDPESLSYGSRTEDYTFQRKAIFENLNSKKLKIVMPGNFQLTTGFNVNVNAPYFGEKEPGDENKDPNLSGKYVIIGSRQLIKESTHETIIEVASTSSENQFITESLPAQQQAIDSY